MRMKIVLVLLAISFMAGGCGKDGSIKGYIVSSNICTGAATTLRPLVQAGVFDANQDKAIIKAFDDANAVFVLWRPIVDANGSSSELAKQVDIYLDQIIAYEILAIQQNKK